mmetsp:Transcript_24096/g.54384  ORF Transcript_24096/g.54384 Transcript_24096/m.54384 type:complete len:205 (+) Transcript_24096:1588-2202(+)
MASPERNTRLGRTGSGAAARKERPGGAGSSGSAGKLTGPHFSAAAAANTNSSAILSVTSSATLTGSRKGCAPFDDSARPLRRPMRLARIRRPGFGAGAFTNGCRECMVTRLSIKSTSPASQGNKTAAPLTKVSRAAMAFASSGVPSPSVTASAGLFRESAQPVYAARTWLKKTVRPVLGSTAKAWCTQVVVRRSPVAGSRNHLS